MQILLRKKHVNGYSGSVG